MKTSSLRTRAVQLLMSVMVVLIAASPAGAQGANGFVYVLRNDTVVNGGSRIYGYRVEPATGLTALSGFPVATGGNGLAPGGVSEGIVIDRANRRLYAINLNSRTVSAFSIAPTTGALTALPFSPISLGAAASTDEIVQCLAVHPSGSPLIVASRLTDPDDELNGRAYSFNVTATTATAAGGSPYLTGADTHPLSCEFSRNGSFFYSGGYDGQHFAGFAVTASTGVLTPLAGSPFLSGDVTGSFATDASGRLFAADLSETVRAHTTSAGIPTEVSSAESGLFGVTWDGLLHPAGFYIVASSSGFDTAETGVYRIGGSGANTTLVAVAGSPFASTEGSPLSLALDRTGTLLFLTNSTMRNVTTFKVDASTGALTILNTQPANTLGATGDIGGIAFVPMADDLAIDFGSAGLWALYNNSTWAHLHNASPAAMATGDLDNDGHADLIATFPASGVWELMNNATYTHLHPFDASVIATGDMDGNGRAEVIMVFPGFGVWVWANNGGWFQLHPFDASLIATGDMDGNGRADVIMVFPGFGVWVWANNGSWFQLHPFDASLIATGDMDGNGRAEVVFNFPGFGVWAWKNGTTFQQLHTADSDLMTTADIDGSGRSDVVISFPGSGIWVWRNDTSWSQLHPLNPQGMARGNLDRN